MSLPGPSTRARRQTSGSVTSSATMTPLGGAPGLSFGAVETSACARKRLGAASELRASVHLMEQGFDVYRCVAPTAPFDLVASRDDELFRVEVKSLSKPASPRGVPVFTWPTNDKWDILILCGDQAIFQFPFGVTRDEVHVAIARELDLELGSRKMRVLMGLEPPTLSTHEWIIRIMSADPAAAWTGHAVLEAMVEQGWITGAKSPLGQVWSELAVLADQGRIERVSRGSYVLTPAGDAS